jgi:arginyl-tRNA synthetase
MVPGRTPFLGGVELPGFYVEFEEYLAKFLDEEHKERKAAERASAASEARGLMRAAWEAARQQASEELERLHVCGLITESEYKNRRAELLGM